MPRRDANRSIASLTPAEMIPAAGARRESAATARNLRVNARAHADDFLHYGQAFPQVRFALPGQTVNKIDDDLESVFRASETAFRTSSTECDRWQASSILRLPDCAPMTISSLSANSFNSSSVSRVTCSGRASEGKWANRIRALAVRACGKRTEGRAWPGG